MPIEVADIHFRLPVEVVYDADSGMVYDARFVALGQKPVSISSMLSQEDWAEVLDSMREGGYLSYDQHDMLVPTNLEKKS